MAQEAAVPLSYDQARLADSRAQFVANLGRRLEAIRQALMALERSPRSSAHRDNLRRRVHALGAAAGVLGFERVQSAFADVEGSLSRAAAAGRVTEEDIEGLSRALDLVPALALGGRDKPPRAPEPSRRPAGGEPASWPLAVLVVGSTGLGEALRSQSLSHGTALECQQTEELERAMELLSVTAPDVLVVDIDRRGARDFVDAVMNDDDLNPVQTVLVGSFDRPEAAAGLISMGVGRVLPKPVGPETLRRTVVEVAREAFAQPTAVEPVGDVTVEALAERVAQEVRRGLVDAVKPLSRATTVPLGDGTDALAAVWSAVARLRELVTMRSGGSVRFDPSGPEGAVPLAPWAAEDRRRSEGARGRAARDVSLEGLRAVVADDDPSVVWFLSGLLTAAGMEVFEAHDGRVALELARQHTPDVVISDIVMPELDGFSLCRAIKRDVVLGDVPVILLSWKEDLLQRVRELGADAQAYLRKEAAGSTVLDRVREVLWPRARVLARVAAGGEVRGRLDGTTPRTLLAAVCAQRASVHVAIRDAAFLYEADVRGGRLRSLTRTASDGSTERGAVPLSALLGVRSGRFSIRGDVSECRGELEGDLESLLAEPVERARRATRMLSDPEMFKVSRVVIDEEAVAGYTAAMTRAMRGVIARLAGGASPAELAESGRVGVAVLEQVLLDLVRHGGVISVFDGEGVDRLASAAEAVLVQRASAQFTFGTPTPGVARARVDEEAPVGEPLAVEGAAGLVDGEAPVNEPEAARVVEEVAPEGVTTDNGASERRGVAPPAPAAADPVASMGDVLPDVPEFAPAPPAPKGTGWGGVIQAPAGSPAAPLEFTRETSPLERALRATSSGPGEKGPGAEVSTLVSEAEPESPAALEAPRGPSPTPERESTALSGPSPTPEPESTAPRGPSPTPEPESTALSEEASLFAALLGEEREQPGGRDPAGDDTEEERPSMAGSRPAPHTKAEPEPSPFEAAFDRLSEEPPEPVNADPARGAVTSLASSDDASARKGWSIVIDEASAPPDAELSDRPTAVPEDRKTREMPPSSVTPPEAFRSSPPAEATDEAIELGAGLAEALLDASPPPSRLGTAPKKPAAVVPTKPITFPTKASVASQAPAKAIAPRRERSFEQTLLGLQASPLPPALEDRASDDVLGPATAERPRADGLGSLPPTERSSVAGTAASLTAAADASGELGATGQSDVDALTASFDLSAMGELEGAPLSETPPPLFGLSEEPEATPSDSAKPVSVGPSPLSTQPTLPPKRRRPSVPSWARSAGVVAVTVAAGLGSYAIVTRVVSLRGGDGAPAAAVDAPATVLPATTGAVVSPAPAAPAAAKAAPAAPETKTLVVTPGQPVAGGVALGADKGILDFDTGDAHSIYVDDVFVGRGPRRMVPVAAGRHEVRLALEGAEISQAIDVAAGSATGVSRPAVSP